MELKGKFIEKFQKETGKSAKGEWQKQGFTIETSGQYPKKVYFVLWNEKTDSVNDLKQGDSVAVYFDAESREYNGRYFTDLKAFNVEVFSDKKDIPAGKQAEPVSDILPF